MAKLSSEKNNILLIILIFVIPLIALDLTYYFITNIIKLRFEKKEQEKEAIYEAERLSNEGNFSNEFSMHFREFFDELQKATENSKLNGAFLTNHIESISNSKFKEPFPKSNLYVFHIPQNTNQTDLIYYKGSIKSGKKALCNAFEQLHNISKTRKIDKDNKHTTFLKNLLGEYTDIKAVAVEMKGMPTFTNGQHSNCWFIWDYVDTVNNGLFGVVLLCDEIYDYAKYGRLLALQKLKSRGKAVGAFIPVYTNYGEPQIQYPLEKSRTFMEWSEKLTIKKAEILNYWLKNSLPQGESLGHYSAYCYLERGDTHIAVVLVKSIEKKHFPKWLVTINFLSLLILFVILYFGLVLKMWLPLSLRARFTISYMLASMVPLSLLSIVTYGYLLQYENIYIEQANNELQMTLKSFDSYKSTIVNEYKTAFQKAINDPQLFKLIEENDINNEIIAKRVVDIFEKENVNLSLPVLGVRIYNEIGTGSFAVGNEIGTDSFSVDNESNYEIKPLFDSFSSTMVEMLRDEIIKEEKLKGNNNIKLKPYVKNQDDELANDAYKALANRDLKDDFNRYYSTPVSKKNGNFCNYLIFDFIKINGDSKYLLCVMWDDKALDDRIVEIAFQNYTLKNLSRKREDDPFDDKVTKNTFDNSTLKNINQNFIAYKINGLKIDELGRNKTRQHVSNEFIENIKEAVKQSSYFKKTYRIVDKENIVLIMPALNFNQTIFVGWINRIDIISNLFLRKITFALLLLLSLFALWICSLRSSSVFLKPISFLKMALDEVSSGNLNVVLNNDSKDELGNLSDEFTKMIDELREKERLSKLISDQAVQALEKNSSGLLNDTETFKGVALVSDIRNFTGMSEKYEPTVITELLNEHFAEMTKIISENGGHIYKFIGDAIEAVFPEKAEYDEPASKRAFKAGSMMISKLADINNRRTRNDLFTYRIGVGLCYGTMFSGTVGSVETRLDYSIIGDPLKNAAKFEALSIQNLDFPIVIGEDIAEKMASLGLSFKKIDSKGLDFSLYTISSNNKELVTSNPSISSLNDSKNTIIDEKTEDIKVFTVSDKKASFKKLKDFLFNSFFVIFLALLITFGVYYIHSTVFDNLKNDSYKLANRLFEELQSNDVIKASFETICLNFYEDIYKALNSEEKTKTFKETIDQITEKYEKNGYSIPYYCCCLYDKLKINNNNGVAYKGFSDNIGQLLSEYALYYKNSIYSRINKQDYRADTYDKKALKIIQKLMGPSYELYNFTTIFFRRSAITTIFNEEMLFDSDRIFNKNHDNIIAYIFCGMPKSINKLISPKYYTVLAGEQMLLAIKNKNDWYFSNNFPDDEKNIIINSKNDKGMKEKGYYIDNIQINNEQYVAYSISKDLLHSYRSSSKLILFTFVLSLLILIFIFAIFENNKFLSSDSISVRLRKDILLSAILPLFTVGFVSYLYVEEEFNVNKSEVLLELNRLMNEIESKELYYSPLCENIFNNLINRKKVNIYINNIISKKGKSRRDNCNLLKDYLKKYIVGKSGSFWSNDPERFPYYIFKEVCILGKDGWIVSATDTRNREISGLGNLLANVLKTIYFDRYNTSDDKVNLSAKGEMITEQMYKAISSNYGSDLPIRVINFPNKIIILSSVFNSIGILISPYPDANKPDFVSFALILFTTELKSVICNMKNDIVPYKSHLASGSIGDQLYCFCSPDINVGEYFFFDLGSNLREDLKTVKELGLASSWVTSSYMPVSRKVNLNGTHYLEVKQGNVIKENIYAALASEYPIRVKASNFLKFFASILFFSLIMIFIIAQSIISDLLYPVKQLLSGAIAVSKGNYKFRINFNRKDELGALCFSFDKMMKGLEEKQLMNRMVSKSALKVTSNLSDIDSKKVDVVLLYVTVPNFDNIMKKTPPFELFSKLRRQISIISDIVVNNGGDIDKIMGEKLLIAFHIGDKSLEEVSVNASNVASLIENCDKLSFKVSVGVNVGQVISGYLGVGEKRDFTIIGDPVNVAARIAVFGEKLDDGKCLVSETIFNYISNKANAKLLGEIGLKGKSQPMKVYQLVS